MPLQELLIASGSLVLEQELLMRNILSDAEATAVQDLVWQVTRTELELELRDLLEILVVEKAALLNVKSAGTYVVLELKRGRNLLEYARLQKDLPNFEEFDQRSLLVVVRCLREGKGEDPRHRLLEERHVGALHVLQDAIYDVHVRQAAR